MNEINISEVVKVLGSFKEVKRSGWIERKINSPESDADHSYGIMFLIFLYCPTHLDKLKCFKLAVIHDLAEIECGDLLPDQMSLEDKHRLEVSIMNKLADLLGIAEIKELFDEYVEKKTPEAIFVYELDKLEAVIQAKYYADTQNKPELFEEFCSNAKKKINLEEVKEIVKKLC